jgi:hypothetical protein
MTESHGPDAPDSTSTRGYQPKPPLWSAPPGRRSLVWAIVAAIGTVLLVAWVAVPGFETHFLSGPAQPVTVAVVSVDRVEHPDEETPRYFHYRVRLPDGGQARFSSQQLFRVGDSFVVMYAKGRLTGRVNLSTPTGAVAGPEERK